MRGSARGLRIGIGKSGGLVSRDAARNGSDGPKTIRAERAPSPPVTARVKTEAIPTHAAIKAAFRVAVNTAERPTPTAENTT